MWRNTSLSTNFFKSCLIKKQLNYLLRLKLIIKSKRDRKTKLYSIKSPFISTKNIIK